MSIRTVMIKEVEREIPRACAMSAELESHGYGLFSVFLLDEAPVHVNQVWQEECYTKLYFLLREAKKAGCTYLYLKGI